VSCSLGWPDGQERTERDEARREEEDNRDGAKRAAIADDAEENAPSRGSGDRVRRDETAVALRCRCCRSFFFLFSSNRNTEWMSTPLDLCRAHGE
jgi:hypothetical protein